MKLSITANLLLLTNLVSAYEVHDTNELKPDHSLIRFELDGSNTLPDDGIQALIQRRTKKKKKKSKKTKKTKKKKGSKYKSGSKYAT